MLLAFPPRQLLDRLSLWTLLWLVVIGGAGALFNLVDIADDRRRVDLGRHGGRAIGTLSTKDKISSVRRVRRCGKGSKAVVQFMPVGKPAMRMCVADGLPQEYRQYLCRRSMPDSRVGIVYDRKDASHFFVTSPDGTVPRRDLTGIWRVWIKRTIVMVLLYSLGTALLLWRRDRSANA